ncbi:MAG TPA: RDD family protein [Cyclobacteriaceae bacterium]|nr:RDD family protein [Cyclobacteriaceae bacterium]
MQIVTVRTAQNVLIDYPIAGLVQRILAFIIDIFILIAYAIVVMFAIFQMGIQEQWVIILAYVPIFFYDLVFEISMNGQSLGKRALDLKVVRVDGGNPTIGNYLLRWLLKPIDILLSGSIAITCILLTRYGQRLGDLAAGTTVVKLVSIGDVTSQQILQHLEENYQPVFNQVIQLTDQDINLIKKALEVNRTLGNMQPVLRLESRIKEMLGISSDMPPVKFLYTVIKDYSHLTSRV